MIITGNLFFTSDLHFGHKNIIKYCDRPYKNTHEMNKDLIERWNDVVKPDDTVINLGDVCFGNPEKYLSRLNGRHILIIGNHDKKRFSKLYDEAYNYTSIKIGTYNVFLHHRPIGVKDPLERGRDIYRDIIRLSKDYDYIVCGHIHEKWVSNKRNLNVGVDVWGFSPIPSSSIVEALNSMSKLPYGKELERKETVKQKIIRLSNIIKTFSGSHPAYIQALNLVLKNPYILIDLDIPWKNRLIEDVLKIKPELIGELNGKL